MPALEPVRERVLLSLEADLLAIAAGVTYFHTVLEVHRSLVWMDDIDRYPACQLLGLESKWDDTQWSDRTQQILEFRIEILNKVFTDRERDTSRLIHDVAVAVFANHTRGGIALNSRVTEAHPYLTEEPTPRIGAMIFGQVQFRTLRTDPTAAG